MTVYSAKYLAFVLLAGSAQTLHCATIQINLVDSFGNAVPFKVKQFKECCWDSGIGRDYANRFKGPIASGLPNTSYKYTLVPENPITFDSVDGRVFLSGENTFVTVQARVNHGGLDYLGFTLSGRISPSFRAKGTRTWVRLLSPYAADWKWDAEVDATGRFIVNGIPERGNYVVVVCQTGGVLAVQPVTIHNGRNAVQIDVSK
jgi:hypothetical protein